MADPRVGLTPVSQEFLTQALEGLKVFKSSMKQNNKIEILLRGKAITLSDVIQASMIDGVLRLKQPKEIDKVGCLLGSGGAKKVYLVNDHQALAMCNLDADSCDAMRWHLITLKEVLWSHHLQKLNLESLPQERIVVQIAGNDVPAIIMPSFSLLAKKGFQIRDGKMQSNYGNSKLCATLEDYSNPEYIKFLFMHIANDIKILLINGIGHLGSFIDSLHIVIKDTQHSPSYRANDADTVENRKQQIRLFFYDLTSKYEKDEKITATNFSSQSKDELQKKAAVILDNACRVFSTAYSDQEAKDALQAGVNLQNILEKTLESLKPQLLENIMTDVLSKRSILGRLASFFSREPKENAQSSNFRLKQ